MNEIRDGRDWLFLERGKVRTGEEVERRFYDDGVNRLNGTTGGED